jgi:hypothetical protein
MIPMRLDRPAADRQSQAGALQFDSEERLDDALDMTGTPTPVSLSGIGNRPCSVLLESPPVPRIASMPLSMTFIKALSIAPLLDRAFAV